MRVGCTRGKPSSFSSVKINSDQEGGRNYLGTGKHTQPLNKSSQCGAVQVFWFTASIVLN